ncbi:MAG: hypothetical protein Q4C75_00320 [Bergeyella zoohelcum]|nr:hypothetical protein [Bergeyella zoohelcum]
MNNNSDDINDLKDKLRETKAKYILLSKPIIFEMEQYYKWTIVEAETGKELYKALLIETMFGNRKNVRKLIADLKEKGII